VSQGDKEILLVHQHQCALKLLRRGHQTGGNRSSRGGEGEPRGQRDSSRAPAPVRSQTPVKGDKKRGGNRGSRGGEGESRVSQREILKLLSWGHTLLCLGAASPTHFWVVRFKSLTHFWVLGLVLLRISGF